jgi:hypothetical protein
MQQMQHNNSGELLGSILGFGTWLGTHFIHLNLNISGNPIHTELVVEVIRLICGIVVPALGYFTVHLIKKHITKEK